MNKIEKVFQVISWIVIVLGFAMITLFIIMCIMLARYDKCQDTGFQPTYCENIKTFKEEKIMERERERERDYLTSWNWRWNYTLVLSQNRKEVEVI